MLVAFVRYCVLVDCESPAHVNFMLFLFVCLLFHVWQPHKKKKKKKKWNKELLDILHTTGRKVEGGLSTASFSGTYLKLHIHNQ